MNSSLAQDLDLEAEAKAVAAQSRRPAAGVHPALSLVWEGTQFRHHSLAVVNREICSRLLERGYDLSAELFEEHQFDARNWPRFAALEQRFNRPSRDPAQIRVRHQWPPNFEAPAEEHLIMIQPWEFGHVPKSWVEEMTENLSELWVPSRYNRQCYIDSGLAPELVQVIPNGVDLKRFHPEIKPMKLATKKSRKFLFVGGTIPRKGINLLLGAFCAAFTSADDVCLIIKDVGVKGVYEGSTAGAAIRQMQARAGAPEILYLDQDMSQDELVQLYRAADVLVHPYLGEGFGMPIVEAMACGLPVMVTGLGAAMDFCNQDNAFLIPARRNDLTERVISGLEITGHPWLATPSLHDFVTLLQTASQSPKACREMGRRGRELVEREFSWETVVDMVAARLQVVANSSRGLPSHDEQLVVNHSDDLESLDEVRKLKDCFAPAVAALSAGRFGAAVELFQAVVAAYPDLAAAHAGLGRSLLYAQCPEAALVALQEALKILPDDPTTLLDRAATYLALKNGAAAEADLDQLLDGNHLVAEASILLARWRRKEGRIDEAAALVTNALDLEPRNAQALADYAVLARDLGYRQGFDRALARLTEVAPEQPQPSWSSSVQD